MCLPCVSHSKWSNIIYLYIYRKQRVPGIWRTSNQSKIEHRWVRTNPTNQGRIYDYVFSSNRKKVNLFFSIYGNLNQKTHSTGIFHAKAGGNAPVVYLLSFVFCPGRNLASPLRSRCLALDHEARVSQENSQWMAKSTIFPTPRATYPNPPGRK